MGGIKKSLYIVENMAVVSPAHDVYKFFLIRANNQKDAVDRVYEWHKDWCAGHSRLSIKDFLKKDFCAFGIEQYYEEYASGEVEGVVLLR